MLTDEREDESSSAESTDKLSATQALLGVESSTAEADVLAGFLSTPRSLISCLHISDIETVLLPQWHETEKKAIALLQAEDPYANSLLGTIGIPKEDFVSTLMAAIWNRFPFVAAEAAQNPNLAVADSVRKLLEELFYDVDAADNQAVTFTQFLEYMMDTLGLLLSGRSSKSTLAEGDVQAAINEASSVQYTLTPKGEKPLNSLSGGLDFVGSMVSLEPLPFFACVTKIGYVHFVNSNTFEKELSTVKLPAHASCVTFVHGRLLSQAVPGIFAVRSFLALALVNLQLVILPATNFRLISHATVNLPELVTTLSYCEYDQLLYAGTRSGDIIVWDMCPKGKLTMVRRITGLHTQSITAMKMVSRHRCLTGSQDGFVIEYLVGREHFKDGVVSSCFSKTGELLAPNPSSDKIRASPMNVNIFRGHESVAAIDYSAQQKMIVSVGANGVVLCFVEGYPTVPAYKLEDFSVPHEGALALLSVDASGLFVVTFDMLNIAKVWDLKRMVCIQTSSVVPFTQMKSVEELCGVVLKKTNQIFVNTNANCFLFTLENDSSGVEGAMLDDSYDTALLLARHPTIPLAVIIVNMHSVVVWDTTSDSRIAVHRRTITADLGVSAMKIFQSSEQQSSKSKVLVAQMLRQNRSDKQTGGRNTTREEEEEEQETTNGSVGSFICFVTAACVHYPKTDSLSSAGRIALGSVGGELGVFRFDTGRMIRQYATPIDCGEISTLSFSDSPDRAGLSLIVAYAESISSVVLCADEKINEYGKVPCLKVVPSPLLLRKIVSCGPAVTFMAVEGPNHQPIGIHYDPVDCALRVQPIMNSEARASFGPILGEGVEVATVCALGPYAASLVASTDGQLRIMCLRPHALAGRCVCTWSNIPPSFKTPQNVNDEPAMETDEVVPVVLKACWVHPYTIVTIDDARRVTAWDVSDVVLQCRLFDIDAMRRKQIERLEQRRKLRSERIAELVLHGTITPRARREEEEAANEADELLIQTSSGKKPFHCVLRPPIVRCVSTLVVEENAASSVGSNGKHSSASTVNGLNLLAFVPPNFVVVTDEFSRPLYFKLASATLEPVPVLEEQRSEELLFPRTLISGRLEPTSIVPKQQPSPSKKRDTITSLKRRKRYLMIWRKYSILFKVCWLMSKSLSPTRASPFTPSATAIAPFSTDQAIVDGAVHFLPESAFASAKKGTIKVRPTFLAVSLAWCKVERSISFEETMMAAALRNAEKKQKSVKCAHNVKGNLRWLRKSLVPSDQHQLSTPQSRAPPQQRPNSALNAGCCSFSPQEAFTPFSKVLRPHSAALRSKSPEKQDDLAEPQAPLLVDPMANLLLHERLIAQDLRAKSPTSTSNVLDAKKKNPDGREFQFVAGERSRQKTVIWGNIRNKDEIKKEAHEKIVLHHVERQNTIASELKRSLMEQAEIQRQESSLKLRIDVAIARQHEQQSLQALKRSGNKSIGSSSDRARTDDDEGSDGGDDVAALQLLQMLEESDQWLQEGSRTTCIAPSVSAPPSFVQQETGNRPARPTSATLRPIVAPTMTTSSPTVVIDSFERSVAMEQSPYLKQLASNQELNSSQLSSSFFTPTLHRSIRAALGPMKRKQVELKNNVVATALGHTRRKK